ncbi:MAG: gamma-glutamyltransferase [Flavicella sp.]
MTIKYYFHVLLVFLLCNHHTRCQVKGHKGMVVSDHHLASKVGVAILEKGGNAIDASIATAFALAVTHPQAGNIGGGGFLVFRNSENKVTTIDFREKAPLAASPTMFLNEDGSLDRGSNHIGLKSVGVPGTVAGLFMAHQKYGSLDWASLVQPSIDLAADGFPMSKALCDWAQQIDTWTNEKQLAKAMFKDGNGMFLDVGELWKQEALARTLTHIRDRGEKGFYEGPVSEKFVAYMQANGGLITKEDLTKYKAVERDPLKGTYKGYDLYTMPPPSSGGVALIEMMNMLELADFKSSDPKDLRNIHLLAETMRRAFADRAEHLGDPDFNNDMPLEKLLSKSFAKDRFQYLDMEKASKSDASKYGQLYDGKNTTHLSVIDNNHNAVSMTYTLEHSFGSGMGSRELGFLLNNEMGDFNPKIGLTDSIGHIGTMANSIAPEKRMLSSMSPTIVLKDNMPYLVIGSPGGRTIINTVFQTVLNVLEHGMEVDEAIEAFKIHHQWLPDQIYYEGGALPKSTLDSLTNMGHRLKARKYLGRLMGIRYDEKTKLFIGASDSSSPDGAAISF